MNNRKKIIIVLFIILLLLVKRYYDLKKRERIIFLPILAGVLGGMAAKQINYYTHGPVINGNIKSKFYTNFPNAFYNRETNTPPLPKNKLFTYINTISTIVKIPKIFTTGEPWQMNLLNQWKNNLIKNNLLKTNDTMTVNGILAQSVNKNLYIYSNALEYYNNDITYKNKQFIGLFSGNHTKNFGTTTEVVASFSDHFNDEKLSIEPYAGYTLSFENCILKDNSGNIMRNEKNDAFRGVELVAEFPDRFNKEILKKTIFQIRDNIFKNSVKNSNGLLTEKKIILCEFHLQYCTETRSVIYIILMDTNGSLYGSPNTGFQDKFFPYMTMLNSFNLNIHKYEDFYIYNKLVKLTLPLYHPIITFTNGGDDDIWVYPMYNYYIKYENNSDIGVNLKSPITNMKASMFYIDSFYKNKTYIPIINIGSKYVIKDNYIKLPSYTATQEEYTNFYISYNNMCTYKTTIKDKINLTLDINGSLFKIDNSIVYLWSNGLTINNNKIINKIDEFDTIFDYTQNNLNPLANKYLYDGKITEQQAYTQYFGTADEILYNQIINNKNVTVMGGIPDFYNIDIIKNILAEIKKNINLSDTNKGIILLSEFVTKNRNIIYMFYLHTDGYWYVDQQDGIENLINKNIKSINAGIYNPYLSSTPENIVFNQNNINNISKGKNLSSTPENIVLNQNNTNNIGNSTDLIYKKLYNITSVTKSGSNNYNNDLVIFNFEGTGISLKMCKFLV